MKYGKYPIKRLRCGKCGRSPTDLVEIGSQSMTFAVSEDGRFRDANGFGYEGNVERLYASCPNGHRWRVRGAVQVTCVDTGPEET